MGARKWLPVERVNLHGGGEGRAPRGAAVGSCSGSTMCLGCEGAAEGGHLEVLQWARANGCPWNFFECVSGATANDKVDVLAWLQEMFVGISDDPALHF